MMTQKKPLEIIARDGWERCKIKYGFDKGVFFDSHFGSKGSTADIMTLDQDRKVIRISPKYESRMEISYKKNVEFQEALGLGYTIQKHSLQYMQPFGLFCLEKVVPTGMRHFMLAVFDRNLMQVTATKKVKLKVSRSYTEQEFQDVVMTDCQRSHDSRMVAVVMGILPKDALYSDPAYMTVVHVYDTQGWREVSMFQRMGTVFPAVSFNPRYTHYQAATIGLQGINPFTLAVYDINTGKFLKKNNLQDILNLSVSEEPEFHLSYSPDGEYIILQVIEAICSIDEFTCRMLVFRADDLQLIQKWGHFLRTDSPSPLHMAPCFQPQFSKCGNFVGIGSNDWDGAREVHVFQLPYEVNLKHFSRSVILRSLADRSSVTALNLPTFLKKYILQEPVDKL